MDEDDDQAFITFSTKEVDSISDDTEFCEVLKKMIDGFARVKRENYPKFVFIHELVHVAQFQRRRIKDHNDGTATYHSIYNSVVNKIDRTKKVKTFEEYASNPLEYDANQMATYIILDMQKDGMI